MLARLLLLSVLVLALLLLVLEARAHVADREPLGVTSTTVQADPEGNFVEARVIVPSARPGERLELRAVRP